MKRTTPLLIGIVCAVAAFGASLEPTGVAAADPALFDNGYGNAQDTVNALEAQGYNVQFNGAAVYPLSGCKVTGVEGLRASDVDPSGIRRDPTRFDTAYVDIACRGG